MTLIVQRTLDVGICLAVLTNPKIFDAISEDGATIEDLKVDVIKDYWLSIIDGDLEIGVVQFKQIFNKCYDSHIHILPEFRKEYTEKSGKLIWKWIEQHLKGCLLYTNVPVFCPNVKEFLIGFGFKETGYLKKAWLKNGKQNDMWILTRSVN